MNKIPMKQLLEVGAHFGHQTRRWNPKMKPYIYGARTGIYIIDLQQTVQFFNKAYEAIRDIRARGKSVLFVGTKRQAQDIVREEALRCGQFFANYRWLGGTLTNYKTVKQSVERLKRYDAMKDRGYYEQVTKKEALKLEKERVKLEKVLGGIKDMERLPGALFVVDAKRERIAIQEAALLGIPSFVMVDTNSDPDNIPYIIPTNDDAIRSIRLFTSRIADAILEGAELFEKSTRGEGAREETVRQVIPGKGIARTVEVVHKRETEEPEEEEKPAEAEEQEGEEGADKEASPE
jgi:small subunit ribosomal protein S2